MLSKINYCASNEVVVVVIITIVLAVDKISMGNLYGCLQWHAFTSM